MGATTERQKTYASGCRFRLPGGLIELTADAVPVRRKAESTGGSAFRSACPECQGAVEQEYKCENGHGPFKMGDLGRKLVHGEVSAPVSAHEQEALKGDLDPGVMELVPTKLDEVLAATRPDATAYRIRPGKRGTNLKLYAALLAAVVASRKKNVVLLGEFRPTTKDTAKPYMLDAWGDMLVAQSLVRPDDLTEREGVEATDDKAVNKMLFELLTKDVQGFDAHTYRNQRREAIEALAAAKAANPDAEIVVMPKAKPKDEGEDLLAALTASLAS